MTSEEQARAIADEYEWSTDWPDAVVRLSFTRDELIAFLLPALRTREAETWEQAAQELKSERRFIPPSQRVLLPILDRIADRLSARAAQPQEPTT